jgi:hypothetical protein
MVVVDPTVVVGATVVVAAAGAVVDVVVVSSVDVLVQAAATKARATAPDIIAILFRFIPGSIRASDSPYLSCVQPGATGRDKTKTSIRQSPVLLANAGSG